MKKLDESLAMKTKALFFIQLWSEMRTKFLGFAIIVRIKDVRIEVRRGQHKFEKTLKTRTRTPKSLSTETSNCFLLSLLFRTLFRTSFCSNRLTVTYGK